MIKTGISQIGGKFRLRKTLLEFTPLHEFFLSLFCGSCIYEVNKNRCRYECFNDKNAELMNYLLVTSGYDRGVQEFTTNPKKTVYDDTTIQMYEEMKQGVLGLVSQEICNRIVRGDIVPRNNIERAYFYYYLNKLSFGGDFEVKGYAGLINQRALSRQRVDAPAIEKVKHHYSGIMRTTDPIRQPQVDKIKSNYAGLNQNRDMPKSTFYDKDIKKIKASYKGISRMYNSGQKGCDKAKAKFRGITPKAHYCGINNTRALGNSANKRDLEKWKKQFNSSCKGINPKTTRPYSNNDRGLLTPLDPKCINRLRYVNLTAYDFRKVYDLFYKAFHVRKGLGIECFIYSDPPYVGTEKYYGNKFPKELHRELVDRMLKTPFNFMLSIGGGCEELYVEPLREAGWVIKEVKTKYSLDANTQHDTIEYLIMNYDIDQVPKMIMDSQQNILNFIE